MRRARLWLILLVVMPLGIVAGIEGLASWGLVGYHALAPGSPPESRGMVPDSLLGWISRPDDHAPDLFAKGIGRKTDRYGMRHTGGEDIPAGAAASGLVCSGGTQTFGLGVADSETWCARLRQQLPGTVSYNMAQDGYGLDQAYLWYARNGAAVDHQDHLFAFSWEDIDRLRTDRYLGVPKPLLRASAGTLQVTPAYQGPVGSGPVAFRQDRLQRTPRLFELLRRVGPSWLSRKQGRADSEVWPVVQNIFAALATEDRKAQRRLVLIYLPDLSDVWPGFTDSYRRRASELAHKAGAPFVDLTDDFRRLPADSIDLLYITPNQLSGQGFGNYSAIGHEWVATKLAQHLAQGARPPVASGAP